MNITLATSPRMKVYANNVDLFMRITHQHRPIGRPDGSITYRDVTPDDQQRIAELLGKPTYTEATELTYQ